MCTLDESKKDQTTRRNIFMTLSKALMDLPKVDVYMSDPHYSQLVISCEKQFVPNLSLVWSEQYRHYRLYIHVAGSSDNKQNAGYAIGVIKNVLAAAGLVFVYQFLHKHRANNRSSD